MAAADDLIQRLRRTRSDYTEEAAWHKFLLDSAYGTGGYKGKFGPTAISHLGWAAEAYTRIATQLPTQFGVIDNRETYLDQFPREDRDKFSKRIDVGHYTNFVGPLLELIVSYVNKSEMHRDAVPDVVKEWQENVDGKGTTWDVMQRETVRPRAAHLGYCPVLYDWPDEHEAEPGAPISLARRRELGVSVSAIPLFPINLLDWSHDKDGDFTAVKIRTDHVVREDLLGECKREERYAIWYRDRVVVYVVTIDEKSNETLSQPEERAHDAGCVPLVIFRGKPTPDDKVRGLSIVGDLAIANRRYFNLESETDDHIRGQVFATLGIPVQDMAIPIGEILGGSGSAIKIPMQSQMGLHYVAPPAGVAETLENRMTASEKAMYRTMRIEYDAPTVQTSGVARAYQFEQTNRRLADLAAGFARAEQKSLRLVGDMLDAPKAEEITVTSPTDFSLEDLAVDIENTLLALGLGLGPTADRELRQRAARRLLPNLPMDKQELIGEELDELAKQGEQDDAMERETRRAALKAGAVATGQDPGSTEDDPEEDKAA
jgi:hypothetical protein